MNRSGRSTNGCHIQLNNDKEIEMAIYKMIFRHPENTPGGLLVVDEYTEAANRNEAAAIFEAHHGVRRVVAGPILVESGVIPEGKTIWPPLEG